MFPKHWRDISAKLECRFWLRQHGRAAQEWLALDDRSWNFRPFNRNVFLVDGDVGLDANAAKNLRCRHTW